MKWSSEFTAGQSVNGQTTQKNHVIENKALYGFTEE